jgi:SMODS and SLOG-associating 2TM effector domain 2
MANNIEMAGPECLSWDCADATASLKDLLKYVEDEATKSITWYWRSKKSKAWLSRAIQFLAVTLAAAAGILPVIGELSKIGGMKNGLWATLLVGFAAALIGLDRAFGYSSGWARYVLAATSIRKMMEEFRMDWTALAAKACPAPTPEQIQGLIQRAKDFRLGVEAVVMQETKDWVTEFQSNLAQLEKDVLAKLDKMKAEAEKTATEEKAAAQPGSIELAVGNADKAENGEVQVRLEGVDGKIAEETLRGSTTWVRLNVAPGHYRLTVSGKVGTKPVEAIAAVAVEAGKIAKPSITLPL